MQVTSHAGLGSLPEFFFPFFFLLLSTPIDIQAMAISMTLLSLVVVHADIAASSPPDFIYLIHRQ